MAPVIVLAQVQATAHRVHEEHLGAAVDFGSRFVCGLMPNTSFLAAGRTALAGCSTVKRCLVSALVLKLKVLVCL